MNQWEVEHSCECRDCCYLRCPRPCPCTPCCCPRNPVCQEDKQPKIVASMLGYFRILRPNKDNDSDINGLFTGSNQNCSSSAEYGNEANDKPKEWPGKALYNECKEQRDYKVRFTSNGLYGRGFNNFYNVLSPCICGKKNCDCKCDLYCNCCNDKY